MNQYASRKKIPALLQSPDVYKNKVNIQNGMVEFDLDGQRAVMPTAEAFYRLLKKVAALEQKVYNTENRISKKRSL